MSITRAFNAVIAIIEGRPKDAAEMLREEPLPEKISPIYIRLENAVQHRVNVIVAKELRNILMITLRLEPSEEVPPTGELTTPAGRDAYYRGIRAVEEILEKRLGLYE